MRDEILMLYTLHPDEKDFRIFQCGVVARNPKEAAAMLGGEYSEPEGGIKRASIDPEELNFVGWVTFDSALFRNMTDSEREVAGLFAGRRCYVKYPLRLLAPDNGRPEKLALREHAVFVPQYLGLR